MKIKSSNEWFGANEYKSFTDPSKRVDCKHMLVPLSEYPGDLTLGPNPREPKTSSGVSKKIKETLENNPRISTC